jgi:predicted helicase
VFSYIYAVFYSPSYRERYAEFLRIDFPRLPLSSDKKLFAMLAAKGEQLVGLHLLESPAVQQLVTEFPISDGNGVERRYPKYVEPSEDTQGRVYINKTQYFEGVDPEVWEFQIGGYQVLDKWLKDRRGRTLSWEDIQHYQRVVVALRETMRVMEEIDQIIPGWPLE